MNRTALIGLLIGVSLVPVGCGSSRHTATASGPQTHATSSRQADPATALTHAARTTVTKLHRLSVEVLWQNTLPAGTTRWIRGPALASLSTAAADRRKRGIRVRLVADDFRILSVRLDPSYASATAVARGRQRVRPYGRDGRPLGHVVVLDERARIDLRRIGTSYRFVVWRVVALH